MTKENKPHTALKITDNAKNNVFDNCKINGAVEIDKEAKGNKFKTTEITATPLSSPKWYNQPVVKYFLVLVQSLLVAYLVYYFGWN